MEEIIREIRRTAPYLETQLSADGGYVRISDGQCSWWQPIAALLPLVKSLPSYDVAVADWRASDQEMGDEPSDSEVLFQQYGDWRKATEPAGFFGHNEAVDTMPVPGDFRHD